MANLFAQRDGVSLNHFISIAVAEKISRLQQDALTEQHAIARQQKLFVAANVINKSFYS